MALTPDFETFARAYEAGENQVVHTRLAADLDTPVSLMLKLTGAQKDAFMLESVTGGEVRGRYSIIGMKPDLIWRCHGEQSALNRKARFDPDGFRPQEAIRSTTCARSWPKAASPCPRTCRRPRPGCSAISAMTWCGWSNICPM